MPTQHPRRPPPQRSPLEPSGPRGNVRPPHPPDPSEDPQQLPPEQPPGAPPNPAAVQRAVGHFAEPGPHGAPAPAPGAAAAPPTPMDTEKQRLRQALTSAQSLQGDARAQAIEQALQGAEDFTAGHYNVAAGPDGKRPRRAVPPQLISTIRPLIEELERPQDGQVLPQGTDPEAARTGSGTDWNSRLGVPEYRTQSDNLASPEATCNVTSLAMVLERLGYSRADAMRAVERRLKKQYLAEQNKGLKVCVMDRPEDLDKMKLPDEVFQGAVKKYLDGEQRAGSTYQKLRGQETTEAQRLQASREFHDNAQFEDVLDLLRHVSGAGPRTSMDQVSQRILNEIEPDDIRRPRIDMVAGGNWQGARTRIEQTLAAGGGAQLSMRHKGAGNDASHIISVQDVVQGGLVVDDPYGKPRDTYRGNQRGDAYAPAGSTQRTAEFKNQVNRNPVGAADSDGLGNDWWASRAQNLSADESLGRSASVGDGVYQDAWRYARLFTPKTQAEIEAAEDARYHKFGALKLPK